MVFAGETPLVILGPTGTGKTALAVELAASRGAHVLSADSRQIYRMMDIGTAKPTPEERKRAPHHLLDLVLPDEPFSVADFQKIGQDKIAELRCSGIPFLIVGGSPFYLYALLGSFFFPSVGRSSLLREELQRKAKEYGVVTLHRMLKLVDPISAERIHPNDLRRLIRALEVWELTGKPLSSFSVKRMEDRSCNLIGLRMNREDLRRRLEQRTEEMFHRGLVEEVEDLLKRGYSPDLNPLRSIGYKETIKFLAGRSSLEEAKTRIVTSSLQFAKHQMTWFKRDQRIHWLDLSTDFDPVELAARLLEEAQSLFP